MKFNQIIKASALGVVLFAFAGCENADNQPIGNRIYISEAAPADKFTQQTETITVLGTTTTSIHVRLAQPLDSDITVTVGTDASLLDEYNTRNGSNYVALPDEFLSFEGTTTIPAGAVSSEAISITIKEFPTDSGDAYCIPLRIKDVCSCSPVGITQATSRIFYVLTTPLRQVVPMMNYQNVPNSNSSWGIATTEWTLEGWIWMSSFSINNQAIFNAGVSAGTEIYIRFGDADVAYNKLQIKTYGSQFNSNQAFSTNTWYHVAFVCGNGKCTMYINGVEDSSMEISGNNYVIESLQLCSSGSQYFRANAQMAQIRFWKKALSASAIQDAMSRQVSPTSDGLFGYWKLDEGQGNVFHDATGNGRDLTCSVAPTWSSEVVDFTNPNKK